MRTLLIILSIGLFFTLIQYSNGIPIQSVSSTEEDDDVEQKITNNLKPISDNSDESDEILTNVKSVVIPMDESDQSSEEKERFAQALGVIPKPEERDSHSNEQDVDDDGPSHVASAIHNDHPQSVQDSDEK